MAFSGEIDKISREPRSLAESCKQAVEVEICLFSLQSCLCICLGNCSKRIKWVGGGREYAASLESSAGEGCSRSEMRFPHSLSFTHIAFCSQSPGTQLGCVSLVKFGVKDCGEKPFTLCKDTKRFWGCSQFTPTSCL